MRVLFVSKPLATPVHDGSLCLVRDLASRVDAEASIFVRRGPHPLGAHSSVGRVELGAGGARFVSGLGDNASTLLHLLLERSAQIRHFVFAPNPRTSRVLRGLASVRRVPSVQTVASPPRSFEGVGRLLFGDIVVAQSEWTRRQILASCSTADVEMIRPSQLRLAPVSEVEIAALRRQLRVSPTARLIVYPGDLEFSSGARTTAELVPQLLAQFRDAVVVFACRRKTEAAAGIEKKLQAQLDPQRVRFAGEMPSILPLLATATLVLFPVNSLFGKVDIPYVLLEAMALGTPVACYGYGPLAELDGAIKVPSGAAQQLLEAAIGLLSSQQSREQVAASQLSFLDSQMHPDKAAAAYSELYRQLLMS